VVSRPNNQRSSVIRGQWTEKPTVVCRLSSVAQLALKNHYPDFLNLDQLCEGSGGLALYHKLFGMSLASPFSYLKHQLELTLFNTDAKAYFEPLVEKFMPGTSLVHAKAQVLSIEKEAEDVITVTLQPAKTWGGFVPGQYVQIGLKINGVIYHRNFSISSPLELFREQGRITLTIQKQSDGQVTPWLFQSLQVGDTLMLSEAKGDFIQKELSRPVLFIAGGTGITPFISMLHAAVQVQQDVVLLYYAKEGRHILRKTLDALNSHPHIKILFLSSTQAGRFSQNHLETYCPDVESRKVFICGPAGLIEQGQEVLKSNGVAVEDIAFEYFRATKHMQSDTATDEVATIVTNGQTIKAKSHVPILNQLEMAGLQPKYGCRMGLCKECQCMKTSGVVFNQQTGRYSEEGAEPIQICVSVPIGEVRLDL